MMSFQKQKTLFLRGDEMRKTKFAEEVLQPRVTAPLRTDVTTVPRDIRELQEYRSHTITDKQEAIPEAEGGDGGVLSELWELTIQSPTYQTTQGILSSAIAKELTETRSRLDEVEKEKQELVRFKKYWLSNQYDSEALATSDGDAMNLLARFADRGALPTSVLNELVSTPEQSLLLLRLVQAKFIRCLGSYLYLTDRGKQVLDAALEYNSTGSGTVRQGFTLEKINGTHPVWNERFRQYRNAISEIQLKIIILGPSDRSPGYKKRVEIRDYLQKLSSNYDVAFPEEIEVPENLLPDESRWKPLDFIVGDADIVFALLIDHKDVTGVLVEITKYGDRKRFQEKAFLLVPEKRKPPPKGSYLPQVWAAAADYPNDKKLYYSAEEFADCSKIRDYVGANADLLRKRICWEDFRKARGLTDYPYQQFHQMQVHLILLLDYSSNC